MNKEITTHVTKNQLFENLQKAGLMNYSINIGKIRGTEEAGYTYEGWTRKYLFIPLRARISHVIDFTANGQQYSDGGNSVQLATIEFGTITGIVEKTEQKAAEVNYTLKRTKITPFGEIFNVNEETFNQTATFTLYDDGWRINQ